MWEQLLGCLLMLPKQSDPIKAHPHGPNEADQLSFSLLNSYNEEQLSAFFSWAESLIIAYLVLNV